MSDIKSLYPFSSSEAKQSGEWEQWVESYEENRRCARAIQKAIEGNYKDNQLGDGSADIIKEFGFNRVNFVLANTIQCASKDHRFSDENRAWAQDFYIPNDSWRKDYCVESHRGLVDIFANQVRRAWDALGLFDSSCCQTESRGAADYTKKVLVLSPKVLKDQYKTPEDQLFLAETGFGCSPTALGRKVFGRFLKDGEKAQFCRNDFLGVISDEHMPKWAKERLEELLPQENGEDQSVTMGGI